MSLDSNTFVYLYCPTLCLNSTTVTIHYQSYNKIHTIYVFNCQFINLCTSNHTYINISQIFCSLLCFCLLKQIFKLYFLHFRSTFQFFLVFFVLSACFFCVFFCFVLFSGTFLLTFVLFVPFYRI